MLLALGALTGVSLIAPWFSAYDPLVISIGERLLQPNHVHWMGTDDLGRDLFSRVLHGAALTMSVSVAALLSSLVLGAILGAAAGYYYKGWPDKLFCWLSDFLMSIPFLIVIAAVLSLSGPGLDKAYMVLTVIMWTSPARIVRAEVIKTMPLEYVTAERAMGSPEWRILFVTVMPACMNTAMLFSVSYLPEIIALEAGLSFLGLGVQPPRPALGKIIYEGIAQLPGSWWLSIFPAGTLFMLVVGVQVASWLAQTGKGNIKGNLS